MDTTTYESLDLDLTEDGILEVTFDAPRRANALDAQAHRELTHLWPDAEADPRVRVVVLKGRGGNFCAGGDLDWIQSFVDDEAARLEGLREARQLVLHMTNFSKPTVSAVRGYAVGAGLVAALMSDISVVAKNATLMDGHTRIGVAAGDHAALLWPVLCGLAKAKYYLFTNDPLSGEEAERIGLVSLAVDDVDTVATALRVARKLARNAPNAISWTKQALNAWLASASPVLDSAIAHEFIGFGTAEGREGVAALREKRRPTYAT